MSAWRQTLAAGCGLLLAIAAACAPQATSPAPTAGGPTSTLPGAATNTQSVAAPATATAVTPPPAPGSIAGTPSATPSPTPGAVLQIETPTATTTPTNTPSPTATQPCVNNLAFVRDITIPDDTQFLPGQPLDKQWLVRNNGECDWDADYRVVLVSGSGMGPRSELALYPARAGSEGIIQIPMQAPVEPGEYMGRWQARSPEGRLFGNVVFVRIVVIPLPQPEEPVPDG